MDLSPYLTEMHRQLAAAAEPGGPDARDLAERLSAALESTFRLALLDALSVAAAEITEELAPTSVELRLRGRDPEFVVVAIPTSSDAEDRAPIQEAALPVLDDDSPMTRINLRLGQDLKERVEDAARASGVSVNTWLVRSATAALAGQPSSPPPVRRPASGADHYRGWVR